jgi:hypothetical protein
MGRHVSTGLQVKDERLQRPKLFLFPQEGTETVRGFVLRQASASTRNVSVGD